MSLVLSFPLRFHNSGGTLVLAVVATIAGLFFAALVGAATGYGFGLYAGALVTATVGLFVWWRLGWRSYRQGESGLFWWAFVLTFTTAFASTFSPVSVLGVMEVWFLAVAILALPMIGWWARHSVFSRVFFTLFTVFLGLSVISSIFGRSSMWAAIYQFLYNLKFPVMLLLGFRIGWGWRTDLRFWKIVSWLWVPIAIFVVFELIAPSVYYALAHGAAEGGGKSVTANPFLRGMLSRVTGPFKHSGVLAYFVALLLGLVSVKLFVDRGRGRLWLWIAAFVYFVLLVLSGQRQEFAASLVATSILFLIMRVRFSSVAVTACLVVCVISGGVVALVLGAEQIDTLLAEWGVIQTYQPITAARTVFYRDSFVLASENFPLGTGLGTFGGVAAQHYDHSLYDQLGYGRYWWYRLNQFLVDTYWPNFIAESGWIGALALIGAVCLLVVYSLARAWRAPTPEQRKLWAMAFVSQFLSVVVSLTSPLYSDPNFVALAMMFFGIAMRHSVQESMEVKSQGISGSPG